VPFVLYHRAAANASKSQGLAEVVQSVIDSTTTLKGATAISDDHGRTKVRWPVPDPEPRVSMIVPTRDRTDLLRVCVDGFLHETRYTNLEVLIADNDSEEEETKVYLAKVSTHPRVRVIPCPGPFNYSKINNLAAKHATGELVGLMNNDLKVFEPDWLRQMVSHAVRPDVGIVGAKLLYEDGTIQHAGVTLGISLASHLYKFSPGGAEGRQGRLNTTQDVSAVTAACLIMRREVWDEVGGLDEDFPVAYNDVDLCLKVRAAGYRILWTPDAVLYHLESRTRGKDVAPEKRERLNQDKARLTERWGDMLSEDPFHSPNFSASHTDSRLSFPPRATALWQPANLATQ
jgi:GT2 family glycosyltransferase